jgi:protein gp37
MNKTKIDWADMTWNPITGCLHSCEYCYARKIATRFGGFSCEENSDWRLLQSGAVAELDGMQAKMRKDYKIVPAPYPFGFKPTFHRYRLDEPANTKKPQTIFVCSMADMFGEWVPDEWIQAVFESCNKAPQHRYLFLTKNPKRLCELTNNGKLPKQNNFWYGSTITDHDGKRFNGRFSDKTFISIEPILEPLNAGLGSFGSAKWIIVGAETGNRKNKVVPERAWIENIVEAAKITSVPVFMKESLRELMGGYFVQEYPWKDQPHS